MSALAVRPTHQEGVQQRPKTDAIQNEDYACTFMAFDDGRTQILGTFVQDDYADPMPL